MKLLIFEPEHEEEMRRPSVERGEVHSLPSPPENHEGKDDLVRMAVQGVQKRNHVSGGAGHDVLALDQPPDEPRPVLHTPQLGGVILLSLLLHRLFPGPCPPYLRAR